MYLATINHRINLMKIITTYLFPPIPLRNFDWHATIEGHEGEGLHAFGRTEQEAIENLKEQLDN